MIDCARAIESYRADGFALLGKVVDEAELSLLRERTEALMLGQVSWPGLFFQMDSPTGDYRDAPLGLGWQGPSVHYRKLEKLELDDRDGRIEWPEVDATLELSLGYREAGLTTIGRYAVDGVSGEGPRQTMRIRAKAVDMKSEARAPRTRAWEGVTLADLVRKVAAEAGLEAVVGDSVAGLSWPYVAQTAESNLHFLTRLLRPLDIVAKPAPYLPIYERLLERSLLRTGIQATHEEPIVVELVVQPGARFSGTLVRELGLPAGCILVRCRLDHEEWLPTAETRLAPHMQITALISPPVDKSLHLLRDGCEAEPGPGTSKGGG